jgi:hypothetical protein
MATGTNKGFYIRSNLVKRINKKAGEKALLPIPKENRVKNRKKALRAFLKRAYLFILTATLM